MANFIQLKNGVPYNVNVAGVGTAYDRSVTLTSPASIITLPGGQTYNVGNFELEVEVDGIAQQVGMDYTETSTTTITFVNSLNTNQTVRIRR